MARQIDTNKVKSISEGLGDVSTTLAKLKERLAVDEKGGAEFSEKLLQGIQSELLGDEGIISSELGPFEKDFAGAEEAIREAGAASRARLESKFGREISDVLDVGERAITQSLEARRGFGTNIGSLKATENEIEKSIKDLEMRREELILSGRASEAEALANIKIQRITFLENAKNRRFSQILQVGQFALGVAQRKDQELKNTLSRLSSFKDLGILGNLDDDSLRKLEDNAGFPSGILDDVKEIPDEFKFFRSGKSIVAVNPNDLKDVRVVFKGEDDEDDLLTFNQAIQFGIPFEVSRQQLTDISLKDVAPDWFRRIQGETLQQTIPTEELQRRWNDLKNNFENVVKKKIDAGGLPLIQVLKAPGE